LTASLAAGPWILSARSATPPGRIERVSVSAGGAERNVAPGGSTVACSSLTARRCTKRTISDDGTRVVYSSKADNLVDGDTNGYADVFLTTISPGTMPTPGATPSAPYTPGTPPSVTSTVRVSVGPGGAEGTGDSIGPSISPDGHWIAFESSAPNLVPAGGDPNGTIVDVFVYHVDDQSLRLASVPAADAKGGDGPSFSASVSNTGTVSFTSLAGNMVAGASGQQVYAREDPAGAAPKTELMSAASGNAAGAGKSGESTISADGTKVAFTSNATNIGSDDAAHTDDVFVRKIGSAYSMAQLSNGASAYLPSISPAGDKVAFLADGIDTDKHTDVYVGTADGGTPVIVGQCSCSAGTLDSDAGFAALSTNGSTVFSSAAPYTKSLRYLNPQVFEIVKGMTPVSTAGGNVADATADLPSPNADASLVAFESTADNLVANDFNDSSDVFVAQMGENENGRVALNMIRVSVYATGTARREASSFSTFPSAPAAISSDGNLVAFASDSSNLVPNDTNRASDIFVRNRAGGTTERVSVANGGGQADGPSFTPSMSAGGRYVVFASGATNLVDGDTNGVSDVFLRDRLTGETRRISEKPGAGQQPVSAQHPSISPNGQFIAFDSAGDFDPSKPPTPYGRPNVFRYHSDTGAIDMVSTWIPPGATDRQAGFKASFAPSVADDGSVAFLSDGFGMTASSADEPIGSNPNWTDVYVGHLDGTIEKASMNNDRTPVFAVGDSSEPRISADGTHVAFVVNGLSDLPQTGADQNPFTDVFVRDLVAKQTIQVNLPQDKSPPAGHNHSPAINGNGSVVAFVSDASNLVPGDTNGVADVFLVNLGSGGSIIRVDGGNGVEPNGAGFMPTLSGDGQTLVFASNASNLVASDGNGIFDWFVRTLTDAPIPCVTCGPGGVGPDGGGGGGPIKASGPGYRFVAADGGIFSFDQAFFGSTGSIHLNKPIVGMAATPTNLGYWLVASDGGVFSFGDGTFYGSTGNLRLNSPVVGMAATPSGKGYWFVAADGGIFSFGDAAFFGSMGGKPLTRPIVGMAATPSGKGYWLVAADGGIFSFGDAAFYGSTGNIKLVKPIVGMDRTASGKGYRFVASDGGVFSFGDASFLGSMGGKPLARPVVGMARARIGDGYWLVASDGGVFSFGSSGFHGSMGAQKLNSPIVGMAG
jgi:Tol biopolymer transport system component